MPMGCTGSLCISAAAEAAEAAASVATPSGYQAPYLCQQTQEQERKCQRCTGSLCVPAEAGAAEAGAGEGGAAAARACGRGEEAHRGAQAQGRRGARTPAPAQAQVRLLACSLMVRGTAGKGSTWLCSQGAGELERLRLLELKRDSLLAMSCSER